MNINDIVLRNMLDEQKQQAAKVSPERVETTWGDVCAVPWLAIGIWLAVALAGLGAAFCGGMWFQAERTRKADYADAARSAETDRETARWARGLSNAELLAKGRECPSAD
jgi:hypothetical protein